MVGAEVETSRLNIAAHFGTQSSVQAPKAAGNKSTVTAVDFLAVNN